MPINKVVSGVICFIGIGSNMCNPPQKCMEAIDCISSVDGITVLRRSSLYRTEPVGFLEQEWFFNAVIEIRTVLAARELAGAMQAIEKAMGRKRKTKWGPRVIDLDILLYGQEVIQDNDLVIPHPEFHKRRFVLVPLCEIASYVIHPAFGVSIRGLMDRLQDSNSVELYQET
ncbi:MAG: 2-amino-4-hydroxy-6-hydroxymethyldihydropteridine diphosphokinase [Syntrophales bacterium]